MNEWRGQAACAGLGQELFFPGRGQNLAVRKAKEICAICPVRVDCLEAHLEEEIGIWGGLTETERNRELRRRGRVRSSQRHWWDVA